MTEVRKVQSQKQSVRKKGTLTVVVVLDPADLETSHLPLSVDNGIEMRLHVSPLSAVEPGAAFMRAANIVVVQVSPADPQSCAQFERIVKVSFPHMPVIAAARNLSLADTRRLMRVGATDVVPIPFQEDDLQQALGHARDTLASSSVLKGRQGKTISFFKSAGGVGATALATQAGCILAAQLAGRSQEACLIDMDVQFGSAALQLDIKSALSVADLIAAGTRLDEALLRSVTMRHASGLQVIAAPPEIMPLEEVSTDMVTEILALAAQEFDVVLVDLPGVWTSWSLSMLAQSDAACLITEMSLPSIRQARRHLDLFEEHGLGQLPIFTVVNRFERGWFKTISLEETEQVLRRKVDFCVANDFHTVSGAIDQGKTLAEIKGGSRVQRDIAAMLKAIESRL